MLYKSWVLRELSSILNFPRRCLEWLQFHVADEDKTSEGEDVTTKITKRITKKVQFKPISKSCIFSMFKPNVSPFDPMNLKLKNRRD